MAVEQLLGGAGFSAHAIAGRVGLPARTLGYHKADQRPHLVAGVLRKHAPARRYWMVAVDLQQGCRMIDPAIEQGRISGGEMKRRHCDSVAKADRHRLEGSPARSGGQSAAALLQLDRNRIEKTHLLEEELLPLGANLVRDLRRADIRAVLHDL